MKDRTRREFLEASGKAIGLTAVATALPTAVSALQKRPNILLFFPDQHRFDWTGLNPDIPVSTPNLVALANRGVQFTNAICPSPICAPSRACLASGKAFQRCGVLTNSTPYPIAQATFYSTLRTHGYHVLTCGKLDLHKGEPIWEIHGEKRIAAWGFSDGIDSAGKGDGHRAYGLGPTGPKDPYYRYLSQLETPLDQIMFEDMSRRFANGYESRYGETDPTPIPEEHYGDNWIGRSGLALLDSAPSEKPWFLQVNLNGPHFPMDITAPMHAAYHGPDRTVSGFPKPFRYEGDVDGETHVRIRRNYSAMVENADRILGLYIDRLKKRDELENTLIVYCSDHGEMLGDHSLWAKLVAYQPSIGVPLVVAGPGVATKRVIKAPVTTMDLTATFLDWAGIVVPEAMDSRSMRPLLDGTRDTLRSFVHSSITLWQAVYDGRHKLIRKQPSGQGKPSFTLFDLREDPFESQDLSKGAPEEVARLTAQLPFRSGTLRRKRR